MKIVTLTLNPALDKSTSTERLLPDEKLRCDEPLYEPGGGGINVSRAIAKMGGVVPGYFIWREVLPEKRCRNCLGRKEFSSR